MNKKLEGEDFGVLLPYIEDENITDIDYNGTTLWITDLSKGRIKTNIEITKEFVDKFTHRIANLVNKPFNRMNSVLEAQTENLRISIVHESVAVTGRSICIRKSLPVVRNTIDSMVDSNFCTPEILSLLINCVRARMNIAFCGEPGVGKTECSKFFTQFIPSNQRVITIEDNLEMHFHKINPENDCVELQVGSELSYTDAIKLCLRQNPKWIMLSEARSTEVKYLLEQWSTGINGFTTLHLDDLRNLPDRIMNMIGRAKDADRLENNIYEFIHVGVLVRQREGEKGIERYIDQVCFYDRNDYGNSIYLVLNEAKMASQELPRNIQMRLKRAGIEHPFWCKETASNFPVELNEEIIKEIEKREREEGRNMEKKTEKEGIFTLLNPKNLQKEIDEYGYNFSIGRYLAFIVAAVAIAAGCGLAFSLKWYFAMLTAIAGILCLPSLILSGYKNMYEHKRFLDVSDYMEQILYSFKGTNKILHALKDTQTLYEAGGKMHSTIQRAVEYVENGKEETDLYREALSIIEDEYPCKRLRAIHEYLKSVEENGGDNDITIDLLLQDKAIWADNIILLQEDKKAARTKITLSIAVTIILALIFHAVYRSMPPQYSIVQNMATQVTTTTYLALNIFIFRRANKELSKSWIDREETDDAKTMRYYKMVTEYDEKKERKKSVRIAAPFFIAAIPFLILGKIYFALGAAIAGILMLNQHKIGYRTAYDIIVKEINQTFPGWLMNMALLLQANNVQVAISKTIPYAPAVLKTDLQKMVEGLKKDPDAIEPYLEFLDMFKLSSVQSAMKMLYAISESGTGDAQSQITVLVQRNSKLMDKAEKLLNEKSLAGMNGIFYLPQVTVSFQTIVNMVVFMLVFLGQMTI